MATVTTAAARFMAKVEFTASGCWEWRAGISKDTGYGAFYFDGRTIPAHRASHFLFKGDVADGLHVDHLCRNRACVNPEHLEAVTAKENRVRGLAHATRKTHCLRGHELVEPNLIHYANGHRKCRTCARAYDKRRRRKRARALGIKPRRATQTVAFISL